MSQLLKPGKYVLAVSGGVDSVVLLDMLSKDSDIKIFVAHFDHGIRSDSVEDYKFVRELAKKCGYEFYVDRAKLGQDASEATAREHRYNFLQKVLEQTGSDAIVTAHHQDDLIETALLNILRGTKHKGLVSLKSTEAIKRPLLNMSKPDILEYARVNNLSWREDSTNQDTKYRRNQIRELIKNSLTAGNRQEIIEVLEKLNMKSLQIQEVVDGYLKQTPKDRLDRIGLNKMGDKEALEIVAGWLRTNQIPFNKYTLNRIVECSKSLKNGSQVDIQNNYYCLLKREQIILNKR